MVIMQREHRLRPSLGGRWIAWMVGMIIGCGLVIAWGAKHQPVALQPCPFDPNLYLGVAFQGPHLHFDTYSVQDKVMNARIAWFSLTEHPDPDVFNYRVAQEPPEEDWDWWTTLYPVTLLVQVTDARKRLGKVEVWKLEGNLLKGILPASPDGSTVIGSLELEAPTPFWRLSIKDKEGQILAENLVRNPETQLAATIVYARWVPHPPKRDVTVKLEKEEPHPGKHPVTRYDFEKRETITEYHDCTVRYWRVGGCLPHTLPFFPNQHYVEGVGIFGPPPEGCSILDTRKENVCGTWVEIFFETLPIEAYEPLCMTRSFVNDTDSPARINPPQRCRKRYVLDEIKEFPSYMDIVPEDRPRVAELEDLQKPKPDDLTVITPSVEVPPFSKGCLHWDINAVTDIRALYFAPVRKVEKKRDVFDYIFAVLPIVASNILGSAHPKKNRVVEALLTAWIEDVSQRREVKEAGIKVGDLKFYGDIWVLHLGLVGAEPMNPLENITQPVTVKVVLVSPDGSETPTDAEVECEPIRPLTTPSPPQYVSLNVTARVSAGGSQVHLAKGFEWLIKVRSPGEGSAKIKVPPDSTVTIRVPMPEMSIPEN